MICIFFEGSQYIPQLENVLGDKLQAKHCVTPYGEGDVLINENKDVICINNAGICFSKENSNIPKAVMYVLVQHQVKQMCILSKVGGINKLLHVGDTVISSDYLDKTTIYSKSILNDFSELPPRYDMLEPFSSAWRKRICLYLMQCRGNRAYNIFDNSTYVCTDGPGFESQAEIDSYYGLYADVVGHYLSPYIYYARELSIALVCVSVVSNSFYNDDGFLMETEETNEIFRNYISAVLATKDDLDGEAHKHHHLKNIIKLM